jgi:hypothetical protein
LTCSFAKVYKAGMANLFYVREAHGFTRHRQVNAAKARGVPDQLVWVEGRTETETLDNLLDHGLRSGDTLEVWRLAVLAEPRKRKGDPLPRKRLADAIKRLASSSIILHEVESNRVFNATDVAADMIF